MAHTQPRSRRRPERSSPSPGPPLCRHSTADREGAARARRTPLTGGGRGGTLPDETAAALSQQSINTDTTVM